jgi:hypothetical protein
MNFLRNLLRYGKISHRISPSIKPVKKCHWLGLGHIAADLLEVRENTTNNFALQPEHVAMPMADGGQYIRERIHPTYQCPRPQP